METHHARRNLVCVEILVKRVRFDWFPLKTRVKTENYMMERGKIWKKKQGTTSNNLVGLSVCQRFVEPCPRPFVIDGGDGRPKPTRRCTRSVLCQSVPATRSVARLNVFTALCLPSDDDDNSTPTTEAAARPIQNTPIVFTWRTCAVYGLN